MHEYWYVAIDIFGNEIKSDVLTFRVTDLHKTGCFHFVFCYDATSSEYVVLKRKP